MARPQVTHITRKRGNIYYYRRRLPRPHMGDISLSLDTDHYREAEYLATLLDHKFDTFFKDETPMVDVKAILRENLKAALEDDRQHHLNTLPRHPVYAIGIDPLEDPREADTEIVRGMWHDTKVAIARREPDLIQDELEQLMKIEGVTEEHRSELKFGLLQVRLQFLEQAMENLKGGAVARILLFLN
jgi:hypothetical protein